MFGMGVVFIEIIPEYLSAGRGEDYIGNITSPPGETNSLRGPPKTKASLSRISSTPALSNQLRPKVRRGSGKISAQALMDIHYEPIATSSRNSFLKIYNGKDKMMASKVYGRITKSILPFLMATSHRKQRPIWIVRAGAPSHAYHNRVDGLKSLMITSPEPERTAAITVEGKRFASWLSKFIESKLSDKHRKISREAPRLIDGRSDKKKMDKIKIMTSTLLRATDTASPLKWAGSVEQYPALNPLDKGLFPGLKFLEAEKEAPEFFRRWIKDKYNTRFPAGESYHDVRVRLESCLIEIEQQSSPVLVIAHGTVLQVLHCYFTGKDIEDCWKVSFPHRTVMEYCAIPNSARGSWAIRSYPMDAQDVTAKRFPERLSAKGKLRSKCHRSPRKRNFPLRSLLEGNGDWRVFAGLAFIAAVTVGCAAWINRKRGKPQS